MKYIYKIYNDINEKLYIGQTTKTIEKRFNEHLKAALDGKKDYPLYRAIRKYGPEHFFIELVEEVPDDVSLDEREQYWIAYYKSFGQPNGYNATEGGNLWSKDCNPMHTEDCRKKVSEKQKVNSFWKTNQEVAKRERSKRSIAWKGEANPGKLEKTRKINSERVSGSNNPACRSDVKEKIRQKATGREASEETKQKMIKTRTGKPGKPLSESQLEVMAEGRRKAKENGVVMGKPIKVGAINTITNELEFEFRSIAAAVDYFVNNICPNTSKKTLRKVIEAEKEFESYKWIKLTKCND